jgi:hypothetical protein
MATLSDFVRSYLETALWSSTDENDAALDQHFGVEDFDPEALAEAIKDCEAFQDYAKAELAASGLSDSDAGFDFWLTRNRHGAGFWDRGLDAKLGRELTDKAHSFGSCDLWVGSDGKVHSS